MKLKFSHGLFIMLLLVAVPIFGHLDELPIQLWDESRLIENALEMNHNGNYIVTKFAGQPDMWNTKPPFLIWLQVICIKLLGMNGLAVRLPSALAALATCLIIYWLLAKKFKAPWLGVISCVILVSSAGYVRMHGTRTADYDSTLTLFITACSIYYYLYLEEAKGKYLTYTIVCLILACLTKGIAGLMVLPALLLYTLYKKKLFVLLKDKRFYAGLAGFGVFVLGYYLLREHYNPGYIQAVQDNELGGRYLKVNESHTGSDYFYLNQLADTQFKDWCLLLIPGILLGIASKLKGLQNLSVFLLVLVISYLYILSSASTKLPWYDMPIYPFLSIIAATFIYCICQLLLKIKLQDSFNFNPLPYALIIFFCLLPYCAITSFVLTPPNPQYWDTNNEDMAKYLKDVLDGKRNIDGFTVTETHPQNIFCYRTIFAYTNRPVTFIHSSDIKDAKKVIAYRDDTKKYIDSNYYYHILHTYNAVIAYHIDSPKHKVALK
ncbi:MAG: glycosyltransferase family 39 protein [Flavipsychrobacter sp.]|nr:glycosyltransferase family 39 protein [Flavipsychrobacter sp.]